MGTFSWPVSKFSVSEEISAPLTLRIAAFRALECTRAVSAILVLDPWMVTWVWLAFAARSTGRYDRRGVGGTAAPAASTRGCKRVYSSSVRRRFSRFMSGLDRRIAVDLTNFLKALSSRRAVAPDIMNGTDISGIEIIIIKYL